MLPGLHTTCRGVGMVGLKEWQGAANTSKRPTNGGDSRCCTAVLLLCCPSALLHSCGLPPCCAAAAAHLPPLHGVALDAAAEQAYIVARLPLIQALLEHLNACSRQQRRKMLGGFQRLGGSGGGGGSGDE